MSSPEEVVAASKVRTWRRRAIAAGVALAVVAGLVWAFHPLRGLPDIGDPFDADELRAMVVPEAENAFNLYKAAKTSPMPTGLTDIPARWDQASEPVRAWAGENREALDLWREGSARPDALYNHPGSLKFDTLIPATQELRNFARLALLEASRQEDEGDLAGAWAWYRAILRSGAHSARNGVLIERLVGNAMIEAAAEPIERWAADPRVDNALRTRAAAEAKEARGLVKPWSHTLKLEYLMIEQSLADPKIVADPQFLAMSGQPRKVLFTIAGHSFSWDDFRQIGPARWMRGEPEVSRRLTRLVFANWLAGIDLPKGDRPEIVAGPIPLFRPRPDSPEAAGRMPPEEIHRRLNSRTLAAILLPGMQRTFLPDASGESPSIPDAEEARWARIEKALGPREQGTPP